MTYLTFRLRECVAGKVLKINKTKNEKNGYTLKFNMCT